MRWFLPRERPDIITSGPVLFSHWSEVPKTAWLWPSFTPAELASKGDGSLLVVPFALNALQAARQEWGRPFVITSAYRDPVHNAMVGGAPLSSHKMGHAFDIRLGDYDKQQLRACLEAHGFTGFGMRYQTFLHADMGRRREW